MKKHECLIIGGGPGGSVLGAYLAKRGVDAAIIEKEVYPRFHIGESLLPHSMDIFREIGIYDRLDSGKYIRKFGAQFVHYQEERDVYFDFATGIDNNHPMAFEVPRAEFDKDLLEHAVGLGATLYQPETVTAIEPFDGGVRVTTNREVYEAQYLADVTGRDAFLGKKMKMRLPNQDLNNIGVFTHYTGVKRFDGAREGDISIAMLGGQKWAWIIPFKGDRTSVGVVCNSAEMKSQGGYENYIETSIADCKNFVDRLASAKRVQEVGVVSNYSHYCETMVGDRWILVGDAATFLDPIFSSGVHMAISTARMAAEHISAALEKREPLTSGNRKTQYETAVRVGTKRFHSFIRMFYDTNFVHQMHKTYSLRHLRAAFTSVVAGDVWNEDNMLFRTGVL